MPKISFTPHQQQAVDATGGNLLVSAAAGSGKTAVLTERVVRLLAGGDPIPADRLIVVTYTKAAAEEMRRRISDRLAERIAEEPENDFLQSQLLLLPSAKICTIHSLCNALIQENAQALGLSGEGGGSPKIAEEADLAVLKAQSLAEVFEEAYTAGDEAFHSLVEFTCVKNDKPLFDLVLALYDFIRSFAFPLDFLDRSLALYREADTVSGSVWGKSVQGYVLSAIGACEGLLRSAVADMRADPTVYEKYYPAFSADLVQFGEIWSLVREGKMGEAAVAAANFQKLTLSAVRKYPDPDFLDALKSRRKKAQDTLVDLKKRFLCGSDEEFRADTAVLLPQVETLFSLVRRVYDRIEQKKRELGVIDYSDLEHYAVGLLVERTPEGLRKTPLAAELAEGYDQIMIDECQDINEVQNLIFTLLSKEETNLFMVGDVKQSIYRFRQAMPALFIEKKKRFPRYDPETHTPQSQGVITLETNFRSRKEVCGIVNFVFARLMSEEMGEIAYTAEEELVPGAAFPEVPAAPEVHIVGYEKSAEDGKAAAEARYIARLIRERVDSGCQVADKGGLRHARYRDFAILLRSYREKAPVYARELTAAGVPCFCDSGEGYFDSYEVMVALNLLRVIDNPLLDVPMLSVLLSPMFGFSADQITEIRLARKNVPFYTAMLLRAEQGDGPCRAFLKALRGFRQSAATGRVDTLIQEIYDRTDFLSLACVMAGGGNPDANLRLLLTYAQKYEGMGAGGLSGFLRYLDRVMQSGGDFSAPNTLSEGADAVRILSIHKSKGLEFPVCILADCAKRFNKADLNAKYQMNASLGFSMKITNRERMQSYTSLPFEAIRLKTEQETVSEEMRVLYVAMTRAKEKLILVMTMPKPEERLRALAEGATAEPPTPYQVFRASGMDAWILTALLPHPGFAELRERLGLPPSLSCEADFPLEVRLVPPEGQEEAPAPAERVFTAVPDPALVERLRRAIRYEYPREPLTRVPAKLTVTQIAKQAQAERITLETRPAFLQAQGLTPAQRGTILHSFMQYADFGRAAADLGGEIERLVSQKFLTREEADALNRKKIESFLRSPLYARMQRADRLLREYKFLYYVKAGEVQQDVPPQFADAEILIQGIADCLLFEPEGVVIIDYKTDYEDDPNVLAERYYDQLRIYKDAMEQAFERPVRQCLLYALHLEREIEIPVAGKGKDA